MTGVFDSGVGGMCAFKILRTLLPRDDLVFLRDRKNCPYGNKTKEEIIGIAEKNIATLSSMGCSRVLIACCTASTVYDRLTDAAQRVAIPITEPTAKEAASLTRVGKIGVIATEATTRSHAFRGLLSQYDVCECAAQPLVGMIERGERDGCVKKSTTDYLIDLLSPIVDRGIDTVILGCTHFHALRGEIERILSTISKRKINTVSSAEVGARVAACRAAEREESGRTVYI